jgi:O-6-methylguanine DNA methyltransferase
MAQFIGRLDLKANSSLWLAWNDAGLLQIVWSKRDLRAGAALVNTAILPSQEEVPEPYRTVLQEYFEGRAVEPARLPVALYGTPFQQKVWRALRDIPRGTVCSYGQVAAKIGSSGAARAVGAACGANPVPIAVPCHRVVGSAFALGGYSGGLKRKIQLLELEGLRVERGRIGRD